VQARVGRVSWRYPPPSARRQGASVPEDGTEDPGCDPSDAG